MGGSGREAGQGEAAGVLLSLQGLQRVCHTHSTCVASLQHLAHCTPGSPACTPPCPPLPGGLPGEQALDLLPSAGLVTSSEDYYPTVAINALMRVLREPSAAILHGKAVAALFEIIKAMGLSFVPYLPKVGGWVGVAAVGWTRGDGWVRRWCRPRSRCSHAPSSVTRPPPLPSPPSLPAPASHPQVVPVLLQLTRGADDLQRRVDMVRALTDLVILMRQHVRKFLPGGWAGGRVEGGRGENGGGWVWAVAGWAGGVLPGTRAAAAWFSSLS